MATNIKPLHDRVIVRRLEETSNQTAGGLFIPDTAKEKPSQGEVIAVGPGGRDEAGKLHFHSGHSPAGATVDLRFDMDTLVVLSAAPHPLDPKPEYQPAAVRLTAWHAGPAAADDPCRNSCPQNQRGFINTERYYAS